MVVLDTTIMIIALPSAQRSLGFSNADRQWVVTAYTLAFGGLLLLGGRISDMIGPKRTLLIGVIGFALASAVGGASQSTAHVDRGQGTAGNVRGPLGPIGALPPHHHVHRPPGAGARLWDLCLHRDIRGRIRPHSRRPPDAIPQLALVSLRQSAHCRPGGSGGHHHDPDRTGNPGIRLDIPGAILGCGGLVSIVYALGEAAADGWHSAGVVGPLVGGILLLVCFVIWQAKGPNPLLPLRVLKNRNRAGSFLTIMLAQIGLFGTFLFLTYLLQTVDHFSPVKTGLAFLPLMVVNGLAATQLASRLMPHVRTRLLVVPGLLVGALGVGLLTRLHPGAPYATYVLPAEILLGLGFGIALVPVHQHRHQQCRSP